MVGAMAGGTDLAAVPPPSSPGSYIGGYSGGNNRGGSTGVYIGGYPAAGRADGAGYYIGGYPGVTPQAIPEKNYPGYKGSTSWKYPECPEPSYPGTQKDHTALITVWLPYEAELWVQEKRFFHSVSIVKLRTSTLAPGKKHAYVFRARWSEGGQVFEETRTVLVQAGEKVKVNFRTDQKRDPPSP
ncbi:MAG TPA: TIGR03000 domain-containing protein [Gemmataceae bacterium]|nr:TIGR03000 domain-containing protein [Gemmataceae bacterium]